MHDGPTELLTQRYTEDDYFTDLLKVTGHNTDEVLARIVIRASAGCPEWMKGFGVRFQSSLRGSLHLSSTNAFFLGGGKALMNSYYAAAERLGIKVIYDAEVVDLELNDDHFKSASVLVSGNPMTVRARAAVLASGGFESNFDWLREVWGQAADKFVVRGTPFNKGAILRLMLDRGAEQVGDAKQCHAVAVDARAPKFDGGIVTRLDCLSLGVVVNNRGERFYDEGEDFWPKRYAIWGRLVADQPDQIAFSIIDSKAVGRFMPSVFPPKVGNSLRELASQLDLPIDRFEETMAAFNRAVVPGTFDHSVLDDCRTEGLNPNKTHWAQRIEKPPFWAYPLRPGITFTYLGLKVDERARVMMKGGQPAANILAAGEIMAGNILSKGYIAGLGMTIGTVFGQIAGTEAARHGR